MGSVNWPEIFIGFSLGLTPLVARQLYVFIKFSRLPGRRKFLGHWWLYHKSTTGSGIVESKLEIKYSILLDRLTVHIQGGGLTYFGHISSRQGMVRYFSLRDEASHERLTLYLFDPFFDPFQKTIGLYMALDLRGLPVAGPVMLSREMLPIPVAETQLHGDVLKVEVTASH